MGRHSGCVKPKLRKGLWSPEEDEKLFNYITRFGVGCWSSVPKLTGLQRCGKSCRLRWINYLRPDLKRGMFSQQEEDLILSLHKVLGNRWAQIAAQLPGRTDNEIKNFWNSCLKKKLMKQGIDPNTHKPISEADKASLLQPPKPNNGLPIASNLSNSADQVWDQQFQFNNTTQDSRAAYDPLFLLEFQAGVGPTGYNSNLLAQYQQTLRPYDHFESNPNFGFTSMPTLTNFDLGIMTDTDFSDNSNSGIMGGTSSFLLNEGKENSSNSSNNIAGFQMNNNIVENSSTTFSWEGENKVDSLFQIQFNGIKTEEDVNPSPPWATNSDDFSSYPLASLSEDLVGANMDVFHSRYEL